jgi:hypothetical protein
LRHGLKALPELISAALLLALWLEPQRFGLEWFRAGVLTLLLEFFVIHAGGFMAVLIHEPEAPRARRALQVGGLGAFYLVFMSAFAWGFDAWWMLAAFTWLCFGKIQALWTGAPPTEDDRMVAMASWAFGVVAFLGAVGLTVIADVPRLGVTDALREAAGFPASGGAWESEPHRALAGAVVYFTIVGLSRPLFSYWQGRSQP